MSVFRRLPALFVVGVVVVGCGAAPADDVIQPVRTADPPPASAAVPSTSTRPTGSVDPTGELHVIVAPGEDGEYPPDLIVTCPGGPRFPISALDDIADIGPEDPDGMLAAIEPVLGLGEAAPRPREGWQLLHQTPEEAILVAPFEENLAFMWLSREEGDWVFANYRFSGSPCDLQYALPARLNTVEWRLDPSAPAPGPETTELHVLLDERECVSGQRIGDRLVGPEIVVTDVAVRVAFAAKPPSGDHQTCPANPKVPYTVELPEPLGDREIFESLSIGISLEDYVR